MSIFQAVKTVYRELKLERLVEEKFRVSREISQLKKKQRALHDKIERMG